MSIIKDLESFKKGQERTLVQGKSGVFYVVSSANLGDPLVEAIDMILSGTTFESETMIFQSDEDGNVPSYQDLYLIRPRDHKAGIQAAIDEIFIVIGEKYE